jgi:hypothetical protein
MRSRTVQESVVLYDDFKEIPLFRWKLLNRKGKVTLKPPEMIILEHPEKYYHTSFYFDKDGRIRCHIKNEKTKEMIHKNWKLRDIYNSTMSRYGLPT